MFTKRLLHIQIEEKRVRGKRREGEIRGRGEVVGGKEEVDESEEGLRE